MRAVQFLGNREAVVVEAPTPSPGPGEVLIRLRAAAVCGSDLHRYRHPPASPPNTFIPGHEPVGDVQSLGAGVTGVVPGERVVVYHRRGCGRCLYCARGDVMLCPNGQRAHGFACDGSDADYMVTDARCLLSLPAHFSDEEGVLLSCNAGTAYAPLRRLAVSGRDTLAVSGLGPVGLCSVMLGRAMGARVVGIDPAPARRALAEEVGAVATLDPLAGPVGQAMRQVAPRGADALIETSGTPTAHAGIVDLLGIGGRAAIVGMGAERPGLNACDLIWKQISLIGSNLFPLAQWDELLTFVTERSVPLAKVIGEVLPIEAAARAFTLADSAAGGKVLFRW
ncbi:MAG TPA: alcohol dehydrogenase catalytic domain-containing protein [Chloroflexota bacterium]|nr:alcohol dehydrogenase catalytic domain-containing protein [Chloroflexota bacterium]